MAVLKYTGGKSWLAPILAHFYRPGQRWVEPFFGGGGAFFGVRPATGLVSDINSHLMNLWYDVKNHPELLIDALRLLESDPTEAAYYRAREQFNLNGTSRAKHSALFVYLNKRGFNGLCRFNKAGQYNVPAGDKAKAGIPTYTDPCDILRASAALQSAVLLDGDFRDVLAGVRSSDFVYLDSPYAPLSKTSSFVAYTEQGFTFQDQYELVQEAVRCANTGAKVLVSMSSAPDVCALWHETGRFETVSFDKFRGAGAALKSRRVVKEMLFVSK